MGKKILSVEERLEKEKVANQSTENTISEENVKQVSETMKNLRDQNPELKILAELPSNNGVEEVAEPGTGETTTAQVRINPKTGERAVLDVDDIDFPEAEPYDHEAFMKSITLEDVAKISESAGVKEMLGNNLDFSDADYMQILELVNKYQANPGMNIYKEFPESVRKAVDRVCATNGFVTKGTETDYARRMFAQMVMSQFVSDIGVQKAMTDFNKEMESVIDNLNEEYSQMWYNYSENRNQYLEKAMDKIEDPEKKAKLGTILDAMSDALELSRMKEAVKARKLWLKKFEKEKPSKLFDKFLYPFEQSTYNIYSVYTAAQTLNRHLPKEYTGQDCMNFLALFCKFCNQNAYKVDVPEQYAFMYYVPYNCVLLDKYRNEEYKAFYDKFVPNVLEIIDMIKA